MRQTGQRGDGLATSGLVLGYMAVIFWGILIALSIVGVRHLVRQRSGRLFPGRDSSTPAALTDPDYAWPGSPERRPW